MRRRHQNCRLPVTLLRVISRRRPAWRLPALQTRVKELGVNGEVHVRIALHKGGFRYKGSDRHGSIHAKALNFAAHLEKVAPRDCIAISSQSLEQYSDLASKFTKFPFPFEEQSVSIYTTKKRETDAKRAWMMAVPIQDSFRPSVIIQRPEEHNKTAMIETARKEVLDFGTALRTCSRYLEATRAPYYYRNEVLRLLERGVPYTCLVLDPKSDMARRYGRMRAENLTKKTRESLERLREFAREVQTKGLDGKFSVQAYSDMPYFACIGIDRDQRGGLLVFSPYMPSAKGLVIGRADTMHLLLRREKASAALYDQINRCISYYLGRAKEIISSRPKSRR